MSKFFMKVLLVFCLLVLLAPANKTFAAKKLSNIKVTMANPLFNPGLAFLWVSNFLGYYQEEGVDAQFVAAQGGAQAMGWVLAGRTHVGLPRPIPILFKAARGKKWPPVTGVYILNRDAIYGEAVAVPPSSPIKSVCDLQGKKIGLMSSRDAGQIFIKKALETCGIPFSKQNVIFLPVGAGSKAATAMKLGRIDAWASVDVQYTLTQAAGFKLRFVPYQESWTKNLFGNVVWLNTKYLKKNRKTAVGFLKGLAKGSLFFYTNPEAALKIHWVLYPESVPKGMSRKKAFEKFIKVLKARAPKLMVDDEKDKRFGAHDAGEWSEYVKFVGLDKKLSDSQVKRLWTNDLIAEVNNFDKEAVIRRAKNFDIKKELKKYKELLKKYKQ